MIIQGVTLKGTTIYDNIVPVTSGLKLYYDPSTYTNNGVMTDLSGNGINGTVIGSPTVTNNAFTFNGSTQYMMSGNVNAGKGTNNAHTVEVWIKPSAACVIWSDLDSSNISSGYRATGCEIYSIGPAYLINTMLWNTTTQRMGGGTATLNTWYQVVRTYNGTSATAYLNKVAANPTTFTWVPPTSTWYVGFGNPMSVSYFSQTNGFSGSYGVTRVYNRALTSAEVTQNYNATKALYGL